MANIFTNAKEGDKFRCRDGSVVSFVEEEGGFYYVSQNGVDDYGVFADGLFLHGTGNGEPNISDLDVMEKIE